MRWLLKMKNNDKDNIAFVPKRYSQIIYTRSH